jgi:hypothetical protein
LIRYNREVVVLLLAIALVLLRPLVGVTLLLGTPKEVVFHHATLLEGVFDWALVVRARFIEHLVKNSRATLGRAWGFLHSATATRESLRNCLAFFFFLELQQSSTTPRERRSDRRTPTKAASLGVVEDCPYHLLARSKVGGNV